MLHLRGQYTLKNKKYKINKNFDVIIGYMGANRITKSFVNRCKQNMADDISQEISEWLLDNFWVNDYEEIRESGGCSPDVDDMLISPAHKTLKQPGKVSGKLFDLVEKLGNTSRECVGRL